MLALTRMVSSIGVVDMVDTNRESLHRLRRSIDAHELRTASVECGTTSGTETKEWLSLWVSISVLK